MISSIVSRLVILVFGTLYPAYASYKAVRTKNVKEYVKWMMYWIVFALFTCAETFTDVFFSFWFPLYYEFKVILVLWLLSPATKGSSILYRKFVHPMLTQREQEIDDYISRAKEQGYHTVLSLGTKGVNYATSVIMQTAIKGGGGLVNQLRRSYSLGDISSDMDMIADINRHVEDQMDITDASTDPRLLRPRGYVTRSTPGGGKVEMYFPEVDVDVRQRGQRSRESSIPLSQIRSTEDISSGYSSGEPLYAGHPKTEEIREPLLRTSSVGSTRVTRTKTARTSVQTKRAPPAEDSVSWDENDDSDVEEELFFDVTPTTSFETAELVPNPLSSVILTTSTQAQPTFSQNIQSQTTEIKITDVPVIAEKTLMEINIELNEQLVQQSQNVSLELEDASNVLCQRMPVVILPSPGNTNLNTSENVIEAVNNSLEFKSSSDDITNSVMPILNDDVSSTNANSCKETQDDAVKTDDAEVVKSDEVKIETDESDFLDALDSRSANDSIESKNDSVESKSVYDSTEQIADSPTNERMEIGKDDRAGKYNKRHAPCPPRKSESDEGAGNLEVLTTQSETNSRSSPSPKWEEGPPKLPIRDDKKQTTEEVIPKKQEEHCRYEREEFIPPSPSPSQKKVKSSPISRLFSYFHDNSSTRLVATSLTSLNGDLEDQLRRTNGSLACLLSTAPPLPPRKRSGPETDSRDKAFHMREMSHSPPRRHK